MTYRKYRKLSAADLTLMKISSYKLSQATQKMYLRDWLCDLAETNKDPKIAVTITLKQSIRLLGQTLKMNHDEARRVIKHLYSRVKRKVFGKAANRHNKKIFMLAAIEGGTGANKRLHIHLELATPKHCNRDDFIKWLKQNLSKQPWVDEQIDIQPINGKDFWTRYITKENIEVDLIETGCDFKQQTAA